ncbi:9192_t:CDS:2, partial [Scutellospora calospora]
LSSAGNTIALKDLFTRLDDVEKDFRDNIRAYNSIFAFTFMGVKLDEDLANVQGGIYHSIGSLLLVNDVPKFLQLYIYDTEQETNNRLAIMPQLRHDTLEFIKSVLDQLNPFVANFHSISSYNNVTDLCFSIKADHSLDQHTYNAPTASQVAAVGSYDLMQYPLLFPQGDYSWHPKILQNMSQKKVTTRQYYAYKLHFRESSSVLLFYGSHLFQQYIVDNYVKIESTRLNYFRFGQDKIRSELY